MKNIFLSMVMLVAVFCFMTESGQANGKLPGSAMVKTVYTVKSGDCLYNIARHNETSVKELCALNKGIIKDARKIRVGQKLFIGEQPVEVAALENQAVSSSDTLVVRPVDVNDRPISFEGDIPLDSLVNYFDSATIERTQEVRPVVEDMSLIVKIAQVGILRNPANGAKIYSANQIIKSVHNHIIYSEEKSFVINENGTKLYIRHDDYAKLLLTCYGINTDIYDCQDPELIIKADQLGIKYNTPDGPSYTRFEIVLSMMENIKADSAKKLLEIGQVQAAIDLINQGQKKVRYSQSRRFTTSRDGKKIYLDCSAYAYFLGNCFGEMAPGKTTANIFKPGPGRHLVRSKENFAPGTLLGSPNYHVVTVLEEIDGLVIMAHSSGSKPLVFIKEKVKYKYTRDPLSNQEMVSTQPEMVNNSSSTSYAANK